MRSTKFPNLFFSALRKALIEFSISKNIPRTFHSRRWEETWGGSGKLIDARLPFSNGIKDLRRQTNRFYNLYSLIEAFTAAIPSLLSIQPRTNGSSAIPKRVYASPVIKFRGEFIYRSAAFKSADRCFADVFSLSVLAGYISPRAEPRSTLEGRRTITRPSLIFRDSKREPSGFHSYLRLNPISPSPSRFSREKIQSSYDPRSSERLIVLDWFSHFAFRTDLHSRSCGWLIVENIRVIFAKFSM